MPLNISLTIAGFQLKESTDEVFVELKYNLPYIEVDSRRYSIYGHRSSRLWRHLYLWQYKTFVSARLPRYKDEKGFYHTIDIPWAEPG